MMKIFKLEANSHSDDDEVRFGEGGRLLDDFDYSYDTPDKQDDQSWDDFGQADDNRDNKNVQSRSINMNMISLTSGSRAGSGRSYLARFVYYI